MKKLLLVRFRIIFLAAGVLAVANTIFASADNDQLHHRKKNGGLRFLHQGKVKGKETNFRSSFMGEEANVRELNYYSERITQCCFLGRCVDPGEWMSSDATGLTCLCDSFNTGDWISCYENGDDNDEQYYPSHYKNCYQCPSNSHNKVGQNSCGKSFYDCECDYGYKKWHDNTCKYCSYQCPVNSYPQIGSPCHESFEDCSCDHGYYKSGEECLRTYRTTTKKPTPYPTSTKKPTPYPNTTRKPYPSKKPCYWCPAHSRRIAPEYCTNTFDDCICDYGLVKHGTSCKNCHYKCPDYSIPKVGLECISSFLDCECEYGYYKHPYEYICIPKPTARPTKHPTPYPTKRPTPYPTYKPTPYPTRRPTPYPTKYPTPYPTKRPTPYPTYKPTPYPTKRPTPYPTKYPTPYPTKRPTPKPTPYPTKPPTPYPTKRPTPFPTTKSPTPYPAPNPTKKKCYWCPYGSYLKSETYCTNTFNDCECYYGYKKWDNKSCRYCAYQCPENSVRIYDLDCHSSFNDCECNPGYKKEGDKCVLVGDPYRSDPLPPAKHYDDKKPSCNYTCPEYSQPKSECVKSINDCKCYEGYIQVGYECIPF